MVNESQLGFKEFLTTFVVKTGLVDIWPFWAGVVLEITIKGSLLPKVSFLSRSLAANWTLTTSLLAVTSSVTTAILPAAAWKRMTLLLI